MSVTFVLTACNRPDLLKPTMESFLKYNTYPITKYIIIEDSGNQGINNFVKEMIPYVQLIYNEVNIGQIPSIDKAYSFVDTDYIFHCEEDWEFYQPGFIEKSLEILKKDEKVANVHLREIRGGAIFMNGHPVDTSKDMGGYFYLCENFQDVWHGFSFNPGLRRLSDYKRVCPYVETTKPYSNGKGPKEEDMSRIYHEMGMNSAIINAPNGSVRHLGFGRSSY